MIKSQPNLVVTGINYRQASLEIRNKFALCSEKIKNIYTTVNIDGLEDFFILSTCNRTEIYSTLSQPEVLLNLFVQDNELTYKEVEELCFTKSGDDAIKHLFRVASGLDSQILGDYEIIGQLKNAFNLAKGYNRTNGFLEKLVNISLQTSREIKKSTSISNGTTSVSYAAIQLLKQSFEHSQPLDICLLGLGKMGTLTLKNLKYYLPQHRIILVNRNENKAQAAANEHSVDYAPFKDQQEVLKNVDVLIVATGADHIIINKSDIKSSRVKSIFDLSMPSNVNADVKELKEVSFYNIDELSQIVNQTLTQRQNELPAAEAIIDEHFENYKNWESKRDFYNENPKVVNPATALVQNTVNASRI